MDAANRYQHDGVVVVQDLMDAFGGNSLADFSQGYSYNIFRTAPAGQVTEDFGGLWIGSPQTAIIDLYSMAVLTPDCSPKSFSECIETYL